MATHECLCVYKGKSRFELIFEISSPSDQQNINFRAKPTLTSWKNVLVTAGRRLNIKT